MGRFSRSYLSCSWDHKDGALESRPAKVTPRPEEKCCKNLCVAILIFLSLTMSSLWPSCAAQEITGSISGTVTDQTGAGVPKAALTAQNVKTGIASKTVSDSTGHYTFPSLSPGTYLILAEHGGFNATKISGISLAVYQKITLDVVLRVGQVIVVQVQESTPLVETNTASLGTVVAEQAILDLPLNLRQVGALALTAPGTVETTGRTLTSAMGNGSGFNDTTYSGAGGRSPSNLLLIDGMVSRALNNGSFALNPPPEMVSEFKIQNNVYDAAFGITSGTVMNLVTESGTNDLHGSVWEYWRNRDMDALNRFTATDPSGAVINPEFNRNQFGGAIGGSIRKNKMFFFGSFEGLRLAQGQNVFAGVPVPTIAQKNGDFTSLLTGSTSNLCGSGGPPNLTYDTGQLFDPKTETLFTCSSGSMSGSTVLVGTPIPSNDVAAYLGGTQNFDSVAQKVLALFPTPNDSTGLLFINPKPLRRQDNQTDARFDWVPSDKDRTFARYLLGNTNQTLPGVFDPFSSKQHFRGHNAVVGWTHAFGPTLINDVRVGYQHDYLFLSCASCPRPRGTLGSFGIDQLAAPRADLELYPNFTFANYATWGDGFPGFYPDQVPDSLEKFEDTLTKIHGRHTLNFGADLNFWQTKGVEDPIQQNGLITFNGQYSGLAGESANASSAADLADMEFGYPSFGEYTKNPILTNLVGGNWIGLFAQDNIRVNSSFSIEVGIRWEYYKQPVEEHNELAAFFPLSKSYRPGDGLLLTALPDAANDALCGNPIFVSASGKCLIMTSAIRRQKGLNGNQVRQVSYGPGKGGFAPRLGLSWRPTNSDKLIIHTGGGIFLDLPITNLLGSTVNNNPVFTQTPTYNTAFGSPPPVKNGTTETLFEGSSSPTLAQVVSLLMPSPFYRMPTVYEWSFSLQSQLAQNWALEVGYVGNRGNRLDSFHASGNQPAPGLGDPQPRRPWPDFNTLFYDSYDAFSNYHAGNVKLTKRVSRGLTTQVAYTYSKSLDDNGGNSEIASAYQDDNNLRADYGVSDFSLRHRLVADGSYQLPFGKGQYFLDADGLANAVVGGWSISGIISYQSGRPLTVTSSEDFSNTLSVSPRPDRICREEGPRTLVEWFNVNCFSTAALSAALSNGTPRFGNSGRNILVGPRFSNTDISIIKRFDINERVKTEFRAEFFNLFNHPNLGLPNAAIGSSTVGQITSAASARDIQFGLKIKF